MKKFIFVFLSFCLSTTIWSQEIGLELIKHYDFKEKIENWTVDNIGNLIVQQGNTLIKIDSVGKQTFTQSIKYLGEISQITSINSMKIVLFSEEQQCICLLDNTLTINGKCKFLEQYNIRNAKFIAASNRPNLIWIYDQYVSSLLLVDIIQDEIVQKVENFAGIAGIKSELTAMEEYKNKLYLQNSEQIYEFDLMLNWSNTFNKPSKQAAFWNNNIIGFSSDSLNFLNINSNENSKFQVSNYENFLNLQIVGSDFYFSKDLRISKYKLNNIKF